MYFFQCPDPKDVGRNSYWILLISLIILLFSLWLDWRMSSLKRSSLSNSQCIICKRCALLWTLDFNYFLCWIYPLMEWNLKSRHCMKVIIISVLYTKTTWVHKRNNKLPNFLQLHNCSSEYMKNHIFEYLNFPVCFIAQLVEHYNGLGSSPIQPDFFSGFNFTTAYVVSITVMINHVFIINYSPQTFPIYALFGRI